MKKEIPIIFLETITPYLNSGMIKIRTHSFLGRKGFILEDNVKNSKPL